MVVLPVGPDGPGAAEHTGHAEQLGRGERSAPVRAQKRVGDVHGAPEAGNTFGFHQTARCGCFRQGTAYVIGIGHGTQAAADIRGSGAAGFVRQQ